MFKHLFFCKKKTRYFSLPSFAAGVDIDPVFTQPGIGVDVADFGGSGPIEVCIQFSSAIKISIDGFGGSSQVTVAGMLFTSASADVCGPLSCSFVPTSEPPSCENFQNCVNSNDCEACLATPVRREKRRFRYTY